MMGHPASTHPPPQNLGLHIAHRLVELGCDKVFAVPGEETCRPPPPSMPSEACS